MVCSFGMTARILPCAVSLTAMYTSKRFTAEDESAWLPAYWLTDMNISTVLHMNTIRFTVRGEISNLFDTDYQVLPGYPMPGRTFRVTVGLDY